MRIPRKPSKLFRKLFLGYAVLTTSALVVCVLLILREFEKFYAEELTAHLQVQAITLRSQVRGHLDSDHVEQLSRIAQEVGENEADSLRVTFISADGTVLGDSQADAGQMESHHDRVEIQDALKNGWGTSTRWSGTVARMLRYVAVRVGPPENPEGVVRVALGVKTIGTRTQSVRRIIWTIAVIAALATAAFALGLARLWTLPIRRITAIAGRISRGDLSARAHVRGSDEIARLARSLNEMRDHLKAQLSTIDGQRQTLDALLNQLREGVIVAGPEGKIVLVNPAAARLLHPEGDRHSSPESWVGRPVEQCVPRHELQRLLLSREPVLAAGSDRPGPDSGPTPPSPASRSVNEVRIELPTVDGSVVVLASAVDIALPVTPAGEAGSLPESGSRTGRMLALVDITEIARTIQMKTDFVANASHELRTPLSAVRGAVETVLGIDLSADAKSAKRFLEVIDRHSARLEALVADLLTLSRLESPAGALKPTLVDWHRFCAELGEKWAEVARKKEVAWECRPPPGLHEVAIDPRLARVVLDNLVDNAIKFTSGGGHVTVSSRTGNSDLIIEVADDGCGIPSEEQERVFERFYQVQTARSGTGSTQPDTRGTGLGLAIVRHAVAAMRGTVTLASKPGSGTRVTVTIPQPDRARRRQSTGI